MVKKMKDNIRNGIAIFAILIIIGMGSYIWINKDTLFRQETTIKYKTGNVTCIEHYINYELVTPKCNITEPKSSGAYWIQPNQTEFKLNLSLT